MSFEKGHVPYNKGKHLSVEHRKKISDSIQFNNRVKNSERAEKERIDVDKPVSLIERIKRIFCR